MCRALHCPVRCPIAASWLADSNPSPPTETLTHLPYGHVNGYHSHNLPSRRQTWRRLPVNLQRSRHQPKPPATCSALQNCALRPNSALWEYGNRVPSGVCLPNNLITQLPQSEHHLVPLRISSSSAHPCDCLPCSHARSPAGPARVATTLHSNALNETLHPARRSRNTSGPKQ